MEELGGTSLADAAIVFPDKAAPAARPTILYLSAGPQALCVVDKAVLAYAPDYEKGAQSTEDGADLSRLTFQYRVDPSVPVHAGVIGKMRAIVDSVLVCMVSTPHGRSYMPRKLRALIEAAERAFPESMPKFERQKALVELARSRFADALHTDKHGQLLLSVRVPSWGDRVADVKTEERGGKLRATVSAWHARQVPRVGVKLRDAFKTSRMPPTAFMERSSIVARGAGGVVWVDQVPAPEFGPFGLRYLSPGDTKPGDTHCVFGPMPAVWLAKDDDKPDDPVKPLFGLNVLAWTVYILQRGAARDAPGAIGATPDDIMAMYFPQQNSVAAAAASRQVRQPQPWHSTSVPMDPLAELDGMAGMALPRILGNKQRPPEDTLADLYKAVKEGPDAADDEAPAAGGAGAASE